MNIKENNFSKVCTEMLEVFKYIPEEEFYKIEPDFIETIYQEHDMYYDFKFDETKQLDEQNFLPETYDMLAYVYRKYLIESEEEKDEFKTFLFKDLSNQSEIKTEEKIEQSIVPEVKKSFFTRFFEFIKNNIRFS